MIKSIRQRELRRFQTEGCGTQDQSDDGRRVWVDHGAAARGRCHPNWSLGDLRETERKEAVIDH